MAVLAYILALTGFEEALWAGVFQLVTLILVALWVNGVYQRFQTRSAARQDLIDELDEFSTQLYLPRRLYQSLIDQSAPLFHPPSEATDQWRRNQIYAALQQLMSVTGRYRALQVKLIPLFGHNIELFGYYLAIWRYLKHVRRRIENLESLYAHGDSGGATDNLHRLLDKFRYTISVQKYVRRSPQLLQPPPELIQQMRKRGNEIYVQYFDAPTAQLQPPGTSSAGARA